MSYVHLWEQKVRCVGSQTHAINNWKRNSGFEDVRSFASHRKQIEGVDVGRREISVTHNIVRVGEKMITTLADNSIKTVVIISASMYSALY